MRGGGRLALGLVVIAAAGLAVFLGVVHTRAPENRNALWTEAGKAALQVLTVAVLGAVIKLLSDAYQRERERLARDWAFRQDKYDRLVEATNALRRVPILVDAYQTPTALDEQLREVVEAGLKLRMIKHQIWSSKDLRHPPFPDHRELRFLFEWLYHYTDSLIDDLSTATRPETATPRVAGASRWRFRVTTRLE
jgi:hypothetical protein